MHNHHCELLKIKSAQNQVALRLLGIDSARADPPGGRIDRLPNEGDAGNTSTAASTAAINFGRPSGILRETAADLSKALSASTPAARLRYIERGLAECLTAGVTSVQTNDWSAWPQYCALADADRLPMRVYLTIPAVEIDFDISPKAGETRGSAHRSEGSTIAANAVESVGGAGPMLECHRVKLFADGSLGASTAALSAPYVEIHRCAQTHVQQRADGDGAAAADGHSHSHDHSHDHSDNAESSVEAAAASDTQNSGLLLYTQEQLTAEIRRARDHGFRLEIHVWTDIIASSALNATVSMSSFSTGSTHSAFFVIVLSFFSSTQVIGDRAAEVALNALRDGGSLPHERPILTHCQVSVLHLSSAGPFALRFVRALLGLFCLGGFALLRVCLTGRVLL